MKEFGLYIGGKYVDGSSGEKIYVENPAARETIGAVPLGSQEDVEKAVAAAQEGLETWKGMDGEERAAYLRKMADYFDSHVDEIAATITEELGAPVSMSADWHSSSAAGEIRYYAGIAETLLMEV